MLIKLFIKCLMSDIPEYNTVRVNTPSSEESSTCSEEMAREQVTRKWEIFAGRNRFYCDGRLMTAPHSGVFLLTIFLITGTSILFFAFDCPYLARNVSVLIPIIGGVLFLFTMSALLRTSLTDPGIIPRATQDEAAYVEQQIEVTNSANSPTYRPPPRTKEILIKGQTVKLKYCFTCKIFRPPRASHCSLCDNCVDRFDHHCPWVGNCVGRRNYRFFYMFIVSLAFLAVFIFACAIAHLILITKDERQFLEAVKDSPTSLIVGIVCFFSVWSILGLAGFHTYLTTSNQTTNEDIKGSFTGKSGQDSFNPYSQGNVCLNCFHILCGPVTPSLIDRRGTVTDEYRMEMEKKVVTTEQISVLRTFSAPVQNGGVLPANSTLPEIYRQTVENTGTYSPIKKQLQRAHIVPSKNCATDKIIPSGSALKPKKCIVRGDDFLDIERSSSGGSPPIAKNSPARLDRNENAPLYDISETYYASRRQKLPAIRPYTPPEKRYSANFGLGIPERKRESSKRPRSSFVYENVHADEFCVQDHCNNINNNTKKIRFSNSTTNVRVGTFPKPEFNRMYIQDNFD